jgi:cyanophycinase
MLRQLPWLVLIGLSPTAASGDPPPQLPATTFSGALVMVGGGGIPDAIRDCFLGLAGGKKARLVVIPTANIKAEKPDELKSWAYWKAQDVASVELLHTRKRAEADEPTFVRRLGLATGVWLVGGDQSRLIEAYKDTAVERELRKLLARGGVVGGTSAGAAVMGPLMIRGGETLAEVGQGFGFLPGVVIDQHFMKRKREHRLLGVVGKHPQFLGLGIDEQTAVVVKGRTLSVLGNAEVRICSSPSSSGPATALVLKAGAEMELGELWRAALK